VEGFESLFRNLPTHNEEKTGYRLLAEFIWSQLVTISPGVVLLKAEKYLDEGMDAANFICRHGPAVCTSIMDEM